MPLCGERWWWAMSPPTGALLAPHNCCRAAHTTPCQLLKCPLPCLPARCRYKKHAGLDCYPPLQIVFAQKSTNRGKLDSHCWFFDGFAYLLQPEICVLFDAGGWWAHCLEGVAGLVAQGSLV